MNDVNILQNACISLCVRAWCNKLATTLTLMNMCMIHVCSNKFVDELFSILHNCFLHVEIIVCLVACMVPRH
jgi:hypothetical protein